MRCSWVFRGGVAGKINVYVDPLVLETHSAL